MVFLKKCRKPLNAVLVGAMVAFFVPVAPGQAALIGTDQVINQADRAPRERVVAFMARDDVRAQLEAFGVPPEEARKRVAALSDDEIRQIAGRLDTLPAGEGVLETILIVGVVVFVVLLITDLAGMTKVFSFTKKDALKP